LLAFTRRMSEVGFVRPMHAGILLAEHDLEVLLARMRAYVPHTPIFQMRAHQL